MLRVIYPVKYDQGARLLKGLLKIHKNNKWLNNLYRAGNAMIRYTLQNPSPIQHRNKIRSRKTLILLDFIILFLV
jgi:hypothetical protein